MIDVDHDARVLGFLLGLGDLNGEPVCHGYASRCDCSGCTARAERVSPEFLDWLELGPEDESDPPLVVVRPRQPYEPIVRRAA